MHTHTCEAVPLVYSPGYKDYELRGRGRATRAPLLDTFRSIGFCPHEFIPDWDDELDGAFGWAYGMVDLADDLTRPGQRIVLAGTSFMGVMAAFGVSSMERADESERRDVRLLGCSVAPWFQPFANDALNNPKSDLNATEPDWFRAPEWFRREVANLSCPPIRGSRSQLYVGNDEDENTCAVHNFLHWVWPNVESFRVGIDHDPLSPRYLDILARNAGMLAVAPPLTVEEIERHGKRLSKRLIAESMNAGAGRLLFPHYG